MSFALLRLLTLAVPFAVVPGGFADATQAPIAQPTTGPHTMADLQQNFLNPALQTLLTLSAGPSAPASPVAWQYWLDTSTTPVTLRIYDGSQWEAMATIDQTGHVLTYPSPVLSGTPKLPGFTGFVYANGGTGITASQTIPTSVLAGYLPAANAPAFTGGDCISTAGSLAITCAPFGRLGSAQAWSQVQTFTSGFTVPSGGTITLPNQSLSYSHLPNIANLTLLANLSGFSGPPSQQTISAILTAVFGSTAGIELCQSSPGTWTAIVPGASGYVKTSNGAGQCATYQAAATGGASTPRSTVRQIVQGGPATSTGVPNFFAGTSASLTPVFQNITTALPLTFSAAQGSNGSGNLDYVYQFTANPTAPTCPASGTDFIIGNAQSGVLTCTALAPIYQCGGTLSSSNGQFSFDICGGATGGTGTNAGEPLVGYVGNGTSAVATPVTALGECTASASALSGCIGYAYNGIFYGTQPTLAAGTSYNVASNIGTKDVFINHWLECLTADQGYAVGDRVYGNEMTYQSNYGTLMRTRDRNLSILYTGATSIGVTNASGSSSGSFTPANWKAGFIIKRAWGGAWLLERDLDPANDNAPAFVAAVG